MGFQDLVEDVETFSGYPVYIFYYYFLENIYRTVTRITLYILYKASPAGVKNLP